MLREFNCYNYSAITNFIVIDYKGIKGRTQLNLKQDNLDSEKLDIAATSALMSQKHFKSKEIVEAFNYFILDIIGYYKCGTHKLNTKPSQYSKKQSPTEFEVSFVLDGKEYRYGAYRTNSIVLEEWLFENECNKDAASNEVCIFYREKENFSSNLKGDEYTKLMSVLSRTHKDQLALTVIGKRVYNPYNFIAKWFLDLARLQYIPDKISKWNIPSCTAMTLFKHADLKDLVQNALHTYNKSILSIKPICAENGKNEKCYDLYIIYDNNDDSGNISINWLKLPQTFQEIVTLITQVELSKLMHVPLFVSITEKNSDPMLLGKIVDSFTEIESQLIFTLENDAFIKEGLVKPDLTIDNYAMNVMHAV